MIIFLFLIKTVCCDPSSELSRRDGSDEGHKICFKAEITKIIPNYHQILLLTCLIQSCVYELCSVVARKLVSSTAMLSRFQTSVTGSSYYRVVL